MNTDDNKMTAAERRDLCSLIRQRARLMKAQVAQRGNELMADFEAQLSSIFSYDDDETWKAAHAAAEKAAQEAKVVIAERCRELGIPKQFAPSLSLEWYHRGQNASKDRRAELRNAAKARIAALEAAAKTEIETISVNGQTELVADGLTSEAAKLFLEQMPAPAALMPLLEIGQVCALNDDFREEAHRLLQQRRSLWGLDSAEFLSGKRASLQTGGGES